jgi:glycosyltransferase involved in cell wall biosynthesis
MPQVYYGFDEVFGRGQLVSGGVVKLQNLVEEFPNSPNYYNILYFVSSKLPADWWIQWRIARKKGIKIVLNQNGVAYPAWHGWGGFLTNWPFRVLLREADYVFFQSQFCRETADQFAYVRKHNAEVLPNCVDVEHFSPSQDSLAPHSDLRLLVAGTHMYASRVELAIQTLIKLSADGLPVRLLIAGKLAWHRNERRARQDIERWIAASKISEKISYIGSYTQAEAPSVFNASDILLHPQYNDACPSLVLEAMASGLPVVYSKSGGIPELVGEEAGVAVPVEISWGKIAWPDPQALAEGVKKISLDLNIYKARARLRAVKCFNASDWRGRHREVFDSLLSQDGRA